MADDFVQVIKFKVDDSDVKRSLSDIEKRAGSIHVKFKVDGSASRILSQVNNLKNGQVAGSAGGLSSLLREQRHAAKSANALATALDAARRGLELFALRLSKAGAVSGIASGGAAAASMAAGAGSLPSLPFGKIGSFAMVLPGLTHMAHMAYLPLRSFAQGSMSLFNTQNRAEKLLQFGMQRNGTADRLQELRDYASGIQARTIYGDEAMLSAAGGWQNRIKDVENSKRMMDLVADYAAKSTGGGAVSAEQMRSFSQQLMQALSGRAITLKAQGFDISAIEQLQKARRKGLNVTEDMEIAAFEKVLSSVKGAAQELAKTDEGKIIQMQNALGDLREEVGRRLQPVFARVALSMMKNMPTIGRMFESFGNMVERFVQVIVNNSESISSFAEKAVGMLEVLSQFPGSFISFAAAAKIASAAIGVQSAAGTATGLVGSLGSLGGSLTRLATSSAWGLLAAEIALIGTTLWEAYKESKKAKENVKRITEQGNTRASLSRSLTRLKNGEITEDRYRSVYDAALKVDPSIAESERFNIWMKKTEKPSSGTPSPLDFDKLAAAFKNSKPVTNNTINVKNDIHADSDMTAQIIKEQLRVFATSQLNFTSRTAAAKVLAL